MTFKEARQLHFDHLARRGWTITTRNAQTGKPLKVPYATSPDGEQRLWFKAQAVYEQHRYSPHDPFDFGRARSIASDQRISPQSLVIAARYERHINEPRPGSGYEHYVPADTGMNNNPRRRRANMRHRRNARDYSTSKFDNRLTELVYELSLEGGPDDEVGDSDIGWAGIMWNGRDMADALEDAAGYYELDADDDEVLADLRRLAGVILYVESQGFVHADEFDTKAELEKHWEKVVEELSYDEDEGEYD